MIKEEKFIWKDFHEIWLIKSYENLRNTSQETLLKFSLRKWVKYAQMMMGKLGTIYIELRDIREMDGKPFDVSLAYPKKDKKHPIVLLATAAKWMSDLCCGFGLPSTTIWTTWNSELYLLDVRLAYPRIHARVVAIWWTKWRLNLSRYR